MNPTMTIKLQFPIDGGTWTDVSHLVREGSMEHIAAPMNAARHSVVDSYTFELKHDQTVTDKYHSSTGKIFCTVDEYGGSRVFTGWIAPTGEQAIGEVVGSLRFEALDMSYRLDEPIAEGFQYPATVGGTAFKVLDTADPSNSIVLQLLEMAGYTIATEVSPSCPDILDTIQSASGEKDSETYRQLFDGLLFEVGYVADTDENGRFTVVEWDRDDVTPIKTLSSFGPRERLRIRRVDDEHDGQMVEWSELDIMTGVWLYVENLPLSTVAGNVGFTGKAIAAGDYFPPDSDIIDIYQKFRSDWLDVPYQLRQTRLLDPDISLVNTSGHVTSIIADAGVAIDSETYEARRAQVRIQNTSGETAKLYTFEIHGDALYRANIRETRVPTTSTNPRTYRSRFVFSDSHADRLAIAAARLLRFGNYTYQFALREDLEPGGIYQIFQERENLTAIDTTVIILERRKNPRRPMRQYVAQAIAAYSPETTAKLGSSSGNLVFGDAVKSAYDATSPSYSEFDNTNIDEPSGIVLTATSLQTGGYYDGRVQLDWDEFALGSEKEYRIFRCSADPFALADATLVGVVPADGSPTYSYIDTGATPGTSYFYAVLVVNTLGVPSTPVVTSTQLAVQYQIPPDEFGLTIDPIVVTPSADKTVRIAVRWSPPTSSVPYFDHYEIQQSTNAGGAWGASTAVGGTAAEFQASAVTPTQVNDYRYRVRVINTFGIASSWVTQGSGPGLSTSAWSFTMVAPTVVNASGNRTAAGEFSMSGFRPNFSHFETQVSINQTNWYEPAVADRTVGSWQGTIDEWREHGSQFQQAELPLGTLQIATQYYYRTRAVSVQGDKSGWSTWSHLARGVDGDDVIEKAIKEANLDDDAVNARVIAATALHWPEDALAYWPMDEKVRYPDDATGTQELGDWQGGETTLAGFDGVQGSVASVVDNHLRVTKRTSTDDAKTALDFSGTVAAGDVIVARLRKSSMLNEGAEISLWNSTAGFYYGTRYDDGTHWIDVLTVPTTHDGNGGPIYLEVSTNDPAYYVEYSYIYIGDGSYTTLLTDVRGGHDGTLAGGPVFIEGPAGGALRFDGVDDSIEIDSSGLDDLGNGDFTIAGIVWRDSNATSNLLLLDKGEPTDARKGFDVFGADSSLTFTVSDGSARVFCPAASTPGTGEWFQTAFVRRGDALETWISGVKVSENTTSGLAADCSVALPLDLGNRSAGGTSFAWPGKIAEPRIYTRALSDAELKSLNMFVRPGRGMVIADQLIAGSVDAIIGRIGTLAANHFTADIINSLIAVIGKIDSTHIETETLNALAAAINSYLQISEDLGLLVSKEEAEGAERAYLTQATIALQHYLSSAWSDRIRLGSVVSAGDANAFFEGNVSAGGDIITDAVFGARESIAITEQVHSGGTQDDLSIIDIGATGTVDIEITSVASVPTVGDAGPAGGTIFEVTSKGLVKEVDSRTGKKWAASSQKDIEVPTDTLKSSKYNTELVYDTLGTTEDYAARYAWELSLGGFSDWHLPNTSELRRLLITLDDLTEGAEYWTPFQSTTEVDYAEAGTVHYTAAIDRWDVWPYSRLKTLSKNTYVIRSYKVGDSFRYREDGGSWSTAQEIVYDELVSLPGGTKILFGGGINHTVGELWNITIGGTVGLSIKDTSGTEFLRADNGQLLLNGTAIGGGSVVTRTVSNTPTANEVVLMNNTSAVTVTLDSTLDSGASFKVKRIGTGEVELTPSTGLIDGVSSKTMARWSSATVAFNGTDWFIV